MPQALIAPAKLNRQVHRQWNGEAAFSDPRAEVSILCEFHHDVRFAAHVEHEESPENIRLLSNRNPGFCLLLETADNPFVTFTITRQLARPLTRLPLLEFSDSFDGDFAKGVASLGREGIGKIDTPHSALGYAANPVLAGKNTSRLKPLTLRRKWNQRRFDCGAWFTCLCGLFDYGLFRVAGRRESFKLVTFREELGEVVCEFRIPPKPLLPVLDAVGFLRSNERGNHFVESCVA
jgi:hypothetical protein